MGLLYEVSPIDGTVKAKGMHQNILHNGGIEVWQQGTSFVNIQSGIQTADFWNTYIGGTIGAGDLITVSRNSTGANLVSGLYSLSFNYTRDTGTSASIRNALTNYERFKGLTISFSVKVKSTDTNVKVFIDDGISTSYSSVAHSAINQFEEITITKAISTSATKIEVGIGTVSPLSTSFYIDEAMLVIGQYNVPFFEKNSDFIASENILDANVKTRNLQDDSVTRDKINADVAGNGLVQNGFGALDVNPDNSTLEIDSDTVRVKDLGITKEKINSDVAGNGLVKNVSGALDVNPDNSTLEINSDIVRVKDLGITEAKLGNLSVTAGKINSPFGARTARVNNTVYQAQTDIIVVFYNATNSGSSGYLYVYIDTFNPPTTLRARQHFYVQGGTITFFVKKGEYWRAYGTAGATNLEEVSIGN